MPLASHSTATIAQALSGIDFPANRQDLIEHAKKNNADAEVIQALNEVPDEQYTSMADVFKGVGQSH
jgi:UDP-glucose 6-dehydrogenase